MIFKAMERLSNQKGGLEYVKPDTNTYSILLNAKKIYVRHPKKQKVSFINLN